MRNIFIKIFQLFTIMEIFIYLNMYQTIVHTKPIETYAKDDVNFSKPCPEENYRYHNATGYFMCTVETAKKCIDLCQQTGCNDLYFMSVIPSKNDKIKRNYRCRCFQDYHVCFYNPLPRYHNIN